MMIDFYNDSYMMIASWEAWFSEWQINLVFELVWKAETPLN